MREYNKIPESSIEKRKFKQQKNSFRAKTESLDWRRVSLSVHQRKRRQIWRGDVVRLRIRAQRWVCTRILEY